MSTMNDQLNQPELNDEIDGDVKLFKFVLTGGPCSGKTTAVDRLQQFLSERGFRVFVVPEAATMLFLNGASPSDFGRYPRTGVAFQRFVLRTQVHLEDNIAEYAKATLQNCVLLCDRGLMDGAAYVTEDEFSGLLKGEGLDLVSARDTRYNGILHLVTAADGAEAFYTLENNAARHESPEEACEKDAATQRAWSGHAHHVIIDNVNRGFEAKMQSLVATVAGFVGLQPAPRKTHVFRLNALPDVSDLPADCRVFKVVKTMLEVDEDDQEEEEGPLFSGYELGPPRSPLGGPMLGGEGRPDTPPPAGGMPLRRALSGFSNFGTDEASVGEDAGKILYSFVRKRSSANGDGADAYGLTTVRELPGGEVVETKQVIGKRVYEILGRSADPSRVEIKQRRYCFIWKRMACSIIEYVSPRKGLIVLRCQCEGEPELPPFVSVGQMAEGEAEMISARHISLKKNHNEEELDDEDF